MAIWQYLLIVIPENSIDKNYNIFENNETEFLPDTDSFWENFDGNISSIISEMDQIIKRADWGNDTFINWKGNGSNEEDNDAFICLNDDKNKIKEFQFRIDLRKASNIINVLQSILNLCKKNQFVLIDLKGQIFKPEIESIIESLKSSNAIKFITDPILFFENLENKQN
ncbi:hypothetical protein [Flavobacterium collinsii]|uniref:Uncharacterized protein n=1 Tax=Flavobacterium collinsii TaxID=1114861 RepID=A0ABN7ENU3_9FLAO|nr:hypothetical protein [Flavobacterium collinsii]CAA9199461.1 hypothetical protein FLACOL7796_02739 [Flavobacterium collinsii]